ncbi:hypothetical protein N7G274_003483 [Stereocaulon virgatum]|uniref:NAD(P)-binding protein n=1 Tax=Stereocaulon virgatum TaxID=373712 RepID=A0ABR4ADV1_9LECA
MPPSTDSPISNRYASLDINLTHPIRTTQLALAYFLSTKSKNHTKPFPKAIIHISSVAGQLTPVAAPIYNVTKHGISAFVRSLAPLDKQLGVRVTAVAPGVIKTPLWTDNPDKLRLITKEDQWVTPEFVAEVMASLVEQPVVEVDAGGMESAQPTRTGDARERTRKVPVEGGMILEVAKSKVRVVEQFNDPGPSGEGNTVGNRSIADDEIFEALGSGKWGVV